MTTLSLDERQQAHVLAFDERTRAPDSIEFTRFERKPYGPWNPYWRVYDILKKSFDKNKCKRLCVVGCGNGRDALIYANLGYDVSAFDISPGAIEIARNVADKCGYGDRVSFSDQPAESLSYLNEQFDIVVGVNVLHHIDRKRGLSEILRVLRPGGRGIFKEPLLTPRRDKLRNSRLIQRLLPKGTKDKRKGLKYDLIPGERNIDKSDIDLIRRYFVNLRIERWHVLAKLSALIGRRTMLERIDWALFKCIPFYRRLGDQAVLIFVKPCSDA